MLCMYVYCYRYVYAHQMARTFIHLSMSEAIMGYIYYLNMSIKTYLEGCFNCPYLLSTQKVVWNSLQNGSYRSLGMWTCNHAPYATEGLSIQLENVNRRQERRQ